MDKRLTRAIRYIISAMSGTVIGYLAQALFEEVLHWDSLSYILSMVIVVLWTFTFNRKFTFRSATNVPIAMLKVACYYIVYIPISNLWYDFLTNVGIYWLWARVMLSAINFVLCYYYDSLFVFGKSIDTLATKDCDKKD